MRVAKAKRRDLETVLGWLQREYEEDGEGFWCNQNLIKQAYEDGELWVVRVDGEAAAFRSRGDIVCVRKDKQRQGLGSSLAKAWIERARAAGDNVIEAQAFPRASFPFWQRHGFQAQGQIPEADEIPIYRMLERKLELPPDAPRAAVVIRVYPEAAMYEPDVPPVVVHRPEGALIGEGLVKLDRRVVLIPYQIGPGDLVVEIEVDGERIYFDKAKYDEAQAVGVERCANDHTLFLDRVECPNA